MYPWKGDTKPTTDTPSASTVKQTPTTMSASGHRPSSTPATKPASATAKPSKKK